MMCKYTSAGILKIREKMKGLKAFDTITNFKHTWELLKELGINRYRGNRAGRRLKNTKFIFSGRPSKKNSLKMQLINPRSVKNKEEKISKIITENDIDLLAVTETWLKKRLRRRF